MKYLIAPLTIIILYACSMSIAAEIRTTDLNVQDTKIEPPSTDSAEVKPKYHAINILPENAYKVGAGDVINLSVWKDATLSREVTVLPDGSVSLPLIGQIVAGGKSVTELEQEIAKRIKRYLPDPVFDVSVMQTNSMMIYVIGKVKAPGQISIQKNINVLQALAMAGGLDEFADEDGIKIIREVNDQTESYTFEYDQLIKGKSLEQNIQLQRGDVVIIP